MCRPIRQQFVVVLYWILKAQSLNGSSSNQAPVPTASTITVPQQHQQQQQQVVGTMATGDTGQVSNVAYMSSGILGPGTTHQYLVHHPSSSNSTIMMLQQHQVHTNGSGMIPPSRTSPTNEMNQCLQPVSEDSIDGTLREFAPGNHSSAPQNVHQYNHHHVQQIQQQQQHHHMPYSMQMQYQQMQQTQHSLYAPMTSSSTAASQPQPQQQQQPSQQSQHMNESSNLSSAGSVSDREPEQGGTPKRPAAPQSATTTEKKVRKRRRLANEDQATPKHERKITEFIKHSQASPKRFLASVSNGPAQHAQTAHSNGSNSYGNDGPNSAPQHEIQNAYWGVGTCGPNSRGTPTPTQASQQQQQHYSSSESNSNSNQSPPGGPRSFVRMIDGECQTDEGIQNSTSAVDEIAKRDRIIEDFRRQIDELQAKYSNERRKNEAGKETIKRLLIEKNVIERKALRDKTTADTPRIGCFKTTRTADSFRDQWCDGYAFDEIEKKQQQILNERNDLINATALLKKRRPQGIGKEGTKRAAAALNLDSNSNSNQPSTSSVNGNADDAIFRRPEEPKEINYQEYIELDEIYKLRREHLKKEELDLQIEREKLERERQLHIRELKRVANEAASSYKDHSLLNKRYLMLSLLGKGGFSEVWKAFDIEENRYVACKIHHVNKDWKEEKKANYVKHAMREKDIHKSLDHCRIVKLYDLFTIDNHSFCTVLEYCPGNDLDFYLKQNKQISEKEARSIIMQVVSALVYLNEKRDPIIHYDLKPANILLESGNACGAIKITDFGLSKIMEGSEADHDHDGIELTSQFAGTYWYLPPETFIVPPPKITCKVDVWSIGVIFYQCIYGKKPFGNELTQQKILEYNTIINAREVSFPPKPQVSSVAQDFIRRCLQYKKEDRADVFELARHELFRPRGAIRAAAGSISSPSIPRSPSINREDDNN
ncbi:unnamed protein product [Caenorhabditis bovis]|uniref:Protein kinase domain-containing protein n=1 Tax=Caenorhabditis bovis TaxID=2654633 RepID=A0A8S1EK42_9PELO|nr:unnamed protein product [Caenorhabditis bovis]